MKLGLLRKLRLLINKITLPYYKLKCNIFFILYGGEGIGYTIEKLPRNYIIPLLRFYGAYIGEFSDIDRGLILHRISQKSDFKKIIIGKKVHIGHNMLFDLSSKIEIGSDSAFGANCQIWTHTGDWTLDRKDEHDEINPVKIGKAVICYSNVIISQGIIIGDYARVGASSVVIKNIPDKTFYAGVPAKFIKGISK